MKICKKLILIFGILFLCVQVFSQNHSGYIKFDNEVTQKFNNFRAIRMSASTTDGSNEDYKDYQIEVKYNNSLRKIPFDKLKEITVTKSKGRDWSNCFLFCDIKVVTTTDVELTSYDMMMGDFIVEIWDELTGEKTSQKYNFKDNSVKSIFFNN